MTTVPIAYQIRACLGDMLRTKLRQGRSEFLAAARYDCRGTQQAVLNRLLALNEQSDFSRQHGLRAGLSVREYQSRVPVIDYEYLRPWIDRVREGDHGALLGPQNRLLMFAMTSGTTAQSKYIPVTSQFLSDYRTGWQRWGVRMYDLFPQLRNLNLVQMTSSHRKSVSAGGIPCGNISGLVASMQGPLVRSLYTIPAGVAEVEQSELKMRMVLTLAATDPHVGVLITANPSTVLQLLESLQDDPERLIRDVRDGLAREVGVAGAAGRRLRRRLRPNRTRARQLERLLSAAGSLRARELWPQLCALAVWTGGSAGAYLQRLRELCDGIAVCDHGLHASEGRMTVPLEANCSSGLLELSTHFFEFIPQRDADSASPQVLTAEQLVEGEEYLVLLTTSSGLVRYNIRDVVRCTGHYGDTPLLEFLHKGAHISSITGEKLAESQVVQAVQVAESEVGLQTAQFTLTPEWGDTPGYTLYVETRGVVQSPAEIHRFSDAVERNLCASNEEYREKLGSGRLRRLRVQQLPPTAWRQLRASRLQRSGGSEEQYKHPCLVPDPDFQKVFLKFCGLTPSQAEALQSEPAA